MGVYRFETDEDFWNFWSGGGQLITETDGKVFATDARVGLAIWIRNTEDEETLTWEFVAPDGWLRSHTLKYDLDTDCWSRLTGFGMSCGHPEHPHLMNTRWITAMHVPGAQLGGWTINFLKNGVLVYSENFELVGRVFETISGNNQKSWPGNTLPDPLTVRLRDFDGSNLAGSPVTFMITSQPKGTKGTGLTQTYNAPPLGAEVTSITVTTDINGIAEAYLELGNKSGSYAVIASSADADVGSPQLFIEYAEELTVGNIEMRAYDDVGLVGVSDLVFMADFDSEGNINVIYDAPIGEMVNDSFSLDMILDAFPAKPDWSLTTEWKWQIKKLGGPTTGTSFTGWSASNIITPTVKTPKASHFGDHELKLNFTFKDSRGARVNTQLVTLMLKLFFEKGEYPDYTDYNEDGKPNWFEYWNPIVGDRNTEYDPTISKFGDFRSGTPTEIYIGYLAAGYNGSGGDGTSTESTGIDTFAETILHEGKHRTNYNQSHDRHGNSLNDADGDWLIDDLETSEDLDLDGELDTEDIDGDGRLDGDEPYEDYGIDGLPDTGDQGEGNGQYDLGEPYDDIDSDGHRDANEDVGLIRKELTLAEWGSGKKSSPFTYGANNGIIDTEDKNGNGALDLGTGTSRYHANSREWHSKRKTRDNIGKYDDEHDTAYAIEHTWTVGSVDHLDWAKPGKQTDPEY